MPKSLKTLLMRRRLPCWVDHVWVKPQRSQLGLGNQKNLRALLIGEFWSLSDFILRKSFTWKKPFQNDAKRKCLFDGWCQLLERSICRSFYRSSWWRWWRRRRRWWRRRYYSILLNFTQLYSILLNLQVKAKKKKKCQPVEIISCTSWLCSGKSSLLSSLQLVIFKFIISNLNNLSKLNNWIS